MPGVTILSPSSALGSFGSSHPVPAMQNGLSSPRVNDVVVSVGEIKEKAKENANKAGKGASALTLIKSARNQTLQAQESELSGDLKGALSAYIKAATLAKMFMDSAEFRAESQPGKKGVLYKEFMDFTQHAGNNLQQKAEALAVRLEEMERPIASSNGPESKAGGSIADRMRSLQEAGLSVNTTKRFSRDVPHPPAPATPPMSPIVRNRFSNSSLSSASASASSNLAPSASNSTAPSPHAFVPLSSLGPPSPTSSPSSSPPTTNFDLTEFSQHFPSIDELDEISGLQLPSVPAGSVGGRPSSINTSAIPRDTRRDGAVFRNFPILPVDPGPRPSSTPNTPTINSFASRPASPSLPSIPLTSPPIVSPIAIPRRPSALGLTPPTSASASPPTENHDLPVTSAIFPKLLRDLMHRPGYKVLLLDVRNRQDFDEEHIKGDAVVCIEPTVLQRETVTGQTIEDSLTIAPRHEWALFTNREKFDLIALYDNSSESFGPSQSSLSTLVRAIYENEFRKILKRAPVQLIGGLEAWKQEFGEEEVTNEMPSASNGVGVRVELRKPPPPPPAASKPLQQSITPIAMPTPISEPSRYWTPPSLEHRDKASSTIREEPARYSLPPRPTADQNHVNGHSLAGDPTITLARRPLTHKPSSMSMSITSSRPLPESGPIPSSVNGTSPIQYPQFPKAISPAMSGSSYSSLGTHNLVSPPPQASINPTLSRRRSDYVDQSQEALTSVATRTPIDYPELLARNVLRPPPAVASSAMERQDNRPRIIQETHPSSSPGGPTPPTIKSDYPVTYWSDTQIGTSGLKNLGNTCYMNATIQCLSATVPFARFFTDGRWKSAVNMVNPMGTKGNLAHAFADILYEMWQGELPYLSPYTFRRSLTAHAPQFGGSDQHDSQEFLSFLLDGLHEDLNRILHKPTWQPSPEEEAELERLPQQIASDQQWQIYRMRNDSLIVDFFQGQFRNRLECLTCHKTSTTYNSFMYLTLPVPSGRNTSKVTLTQCLDAFVKSEVMEKTDAWHCPNCKALRRATKQLSLSRLPPVLLIHLKRFSVQGPFTDKIETLVDFPLRSLDLTNYMPAPLPPGIDKSQLNGGNRLSSSDPRAQVPPYKYDLYGVTNHSGNLSNGHYTSFIASRGGWLYCDDSRVQPTNAEEVVGRRAYVLFYKRTKS